jgi:hypothetical protein
MSNNRFSNANGNQQSSLSAGQFPIDLVYLWVDGSDPVWLAKKNAALAAMNEPVHESAVASAYIPDRWIDKNELKFSLRSIEKFMPWINHIYVVTDSQVPKWLNADNPRISIVDHRDIVPPEYLPTFNSSALELFLHKIPGLSEHYIFANDDFFAGAPSTPEFFFNKSGDPIVMIREKRYFQNIYSASGYAHAFQERQLFGRMTLSTLRLVHELTGKRYYMILCHSMESMRKSYMEDIMSQHGDKLIPDTATTFRKQNNIHRIFFPLYNHALGRTDLVAEWHFGNQRKPLSAGASLLGVRGRTHWRKFLWALRFYCHDYADIKRNVYDTVSRAKPVVFCINNSETFASFIDDMEKLFPHKSEFEK